MSKESFLDELRSTLSGSVSADVINDNLKYYENYINTEIRKGRSEEEILEELGSPRLIAKTVIDTADSSERRTVSSGNGEDESAQDTASGVMPWWLILIIIFGIMIAAYIIINVAVVLLPVLIIVVVCGFAVRLLRKR